MLLCFSVYNQAFSRLNRNHHKDAETRRECTNVNHFTSPISICYQLDEVLNPRATELSSDDPQYRYM
jgi:hypothetical protein